MDTLTYEDSKQLAKGSVKKILKQGKQQKRSERQMGQVGLMGHVTYLIWDMLFWPHRAFIGWALLTLETTLIIVRHFQ